VGGPVCPALRGHARRRLAASEWPCDAFLVQRCFGTPTLLFGPRGAGSHNANEYVEVPSLLKVAEVYLAAALAWSA
jgi:acetylornithine deacetylase